MYLQERLSQARSRDLTFFSVYWVGPVELKCFPKVKPCLPLSYPLDLKELNERGIRYDKGMSLKTLMESVMEHGRQARVESTHLEFVTLVCFFQCYREG